ncbi:hypothetical protein BCR39DRAFT_536618 [Naematelia encephala]|uniref:Zn(2)-C6 fungal-type domain-containing protein n=1 Tax=Naematelia encephala TaxID=71784 RepID=A0A1Y2AZ92_9TREE|nr:hypothetical protein BCR39DRAFT_536618 [Naematelia encephala]
MSTLIGPKPNHACVACRAIKTRCGSDPNDPSGPCLRCQRLRITCDYSRKKPGRKAGQKSLSSTGIDRDSVGSTSDSNTVTFAKDLFDIRTNRAPPPFPATTTVPAIRPNFNPPSQGPSEPTPGSMHSCTADGVVPSTLDVTDHLDPEIPPDGRPIGRPLPARVRTQAGRNEAGGVVVQDPVSLDYVSQLEAEGLMKMYYEHLNPQIAILDYKLHTVDYVRHTSSILFTAILAVSAKFFRPQIYPPLLTHAQTILNRAMAVGECDLGIVQALLILVYWKTPTDRSAWVKLGIGIRLGYQLGLHARRKTPLPADEMQARTIRAAERTWFCLSCFDRAYSEIFDLPHTIRLEELGDAEAWANENPDLRIVADLHVASAVATASAQLMWAKFRQTRHTLPPEWRLVFLQDIYAQYERHEEHWFPEHPDRRLFGEVEHRSLRWFDLNHLFKLKFEMIDCAAPAEVPNLIKECLILAHEFTEQTEQLGYDGSLLYLQDTSAAHLSAFGMVAYKLFWLLDVSQKRLILRAVERLHRCCKDVAGGDEDAITAFIARFFQRLLQTINAESRAASRASSPNIRPDQVDLSADQPLFSLFSDQDDIMRISTMPADDNHVLDDQYW